MSNESSREREHPSAWALWRRNLIVWLGLMILLGMTFWFSYWRLGKLNLVIAFGIATAKAALVALMYMELRDSRAIVRLAAAASLFWLAILFLLTIADYATRMS